MTAPSRSALQRLETRWTAALERTEPPFDEERSRARWLESFHERQRRTESRAPRRSWPWLAAAALLLGSIGLVLANGWLPRVAPGPQAGAWLETAAGQSQPLVFGDGSRIEIAGASRVRVASVEPAGARIVVERGSVEASVVHRAGTDWTFVSGPFVVQVTGTELVVHWDPEAQDFSVAVTEGSVWVTGPMLPGGRSVTAGQRCRVRVADARLEVTPLATVTAADVSAPSVRLDQLPLEPPPEPADAAVPRANSTADSPPLSFVALERAGRYEAALTAAERAGIEGILAQGSALELASLERAARLGGRPGLARSALLATRSRFAGSAEAATAAYLLGRTAPPAEAARWFEAYLSENPGGSLVREAAGRLIESYHRARNGAAAEAAARQYLARYPGGPHSAFARSVLGVDVTTE